MPLFDHSSTYSHCCSVPRMLQMGFFADAGPLQIFVSNHVSNKLQVLSILAESVWAVLLFDSRI